MVLSLVVGVTALVIGYVIEVRRMRPPSQKWLDDWEASDVETAILESELEDAPTIGHGPALLEMEREGTLVGAAAGHVPGTPLGGTGGAGGGGGTVAATAPSPRSTATVRACEVVRSLAHRSPPRTHRSGRRRSSRSPSRRRTWS
jgi:hypothetical protein